MMDGRFDHYFFEVFAERHAQREKAEEPESLLPLAVSVAVALATVTCLIAFS